MASRSRPFSTDHDELAAPHLAGRPSGVELLPEALPDALNEQPHRLSGDLDEALHPQHSELFRDGGEAREQAGRIGCRGNIDDETLEVVVIVAVFGIVVRRALREIVLRPRRLVRAGWRDRSVPPGFRRA